MLSILEKPNTLLKLEGLAVFLLALSIYWQQSFSWTLFWSTVLLPDIALLGYLVNAKVGARMYNITHSKAVAKCISRCCHRNGQCLVFGLGAYLVRAHWHRPHVGLRAEVPGGIQDHSSRHHRASHVAAICHAGNENVALC